MLHNGKTLIYKILNFPKIWVKLGSQWAQMTWTHSWTIADIAHGQLCWWFWTSLFGCAPKGNILCCQAWYRGHKNLGMTSTLILGLWLKIWRCCGTIMEWRSRMSTSVGTCSFKPFCLCLLMILQQHITCLDRARKFVAYAHIVSNKQTLSTWASHEK
jgi:hypothetical protein